MVSAANMSPVPEKKRGSNGVSILNKRGLKSDVAVEPMIVMFSISSSKGGGGEEEGFEGGDVGNAAG